MKVDYEVIVVGGGPVGMMVAAELALAKVKVCLLDRLKQTTPYSVLTGAYHTPANVGNPGYARAESEIARQRQADGDGAFCSA